MNLTEFKYVLDDYLKNAFYTITVLSAVPLLLSSALGLIVSLIQAATQVQEQTTLFLIKLVGITILIYLGGGAAIGLMTRQIEEILASIALLGRIS